MQALFFKKACYFGKIFTELEKFLPNWKSFTELENFLPNWKIFYQTGKIFTKLERFLPNWKSFYQTGKIFGHKKNHIQSGFVCGFEGMIFI